ncbi:UpxY family transcription antiterminator [Salinivirga cyanobacteriivorans]|nr:UpxY family transcription antiterminator [Salinivirga cyanobacteriivorans]
MSEKNWYAVYTRPRSEKKTHQMLLERGIETYLPLIKTLRQWSDRKKRVELPLIPSYVFVNIEEKNYRSVLEVDGALGFITFERKKVPIPERQMKALMGIVEHGLDVEATAANIHSGDKVRIGSGPLRGTQGEVVDIAGKNRFVLRIDMGYTLIVDIQGAEIIKV